MELKSQVMEIVKSLEKMYPTVDDERDAYEYLNEALGIEYTVNGQKEYLGARILVSFGGPNIWINTRRSTVEGFWWGESFEAGYLDGLGLDEACEDIFSAT